MVFALKYRKQVFSREKKRTTCLEHLSGIIEIQHCPWKALVPWVLGQQGGQKQGKDSQGHQGSACLG